MTKRPQRWQARGAWRLLCGAAILACASAAPGAGLPPAEDLRRDSLEMAREGHPVVVLYVQHACPWCERALAYLVPMSRSAPRQAAFRQVDLHASRTLIDFGGRRTTERRFAQAEGIRFTPMLVIYGPGGERLAPRRRTPGRTDCRHAATRVLRTLRRTGDPAGSRTPVRKRT